MSHLHPDELVDLAEGLRTDASAPHLESCEACRRQLAEMRATMAAAARTEVPEPSPLFWDHLSARVRDAVVEEAAPLGESLFDWQWSRVLSPLSVAACAAVVLAAAVIMDSRHAADVAPPSTQVAEAGLAAESADDPSLDLVADLAAQVDWENAGDTAINVRGHEDPADKAASQLSDGERRELRRLLQEELSHTGN